MIKVLKLQKAVIAIVFGVITFIIAQVMSSNQVAGSSYVLGFSGFLFIIGALLFLYPIIFAKKADHDGKDVVLKPIAKEDIDNESAI